MRVFLLYISWPLIFEVKEWNCVWMGFICLLGKNFTSDLWLTAGGKTAGQADVQAAKNILSKNVVCDTKTFKTGPCLLVSGCRSVSDFVHLRVCCLSSGSTPRYAGRWWFRAFGEFASCCLQIWGIIEAEPVFNWRIPGVEKTYEHSSGGDKALLGDTTLQSWRQLILPLTF